MTQEALATAAGIRRATMIRLETGRHAPRVSTLRAIAQVLGSPVEDLLAGPDEPKEN